MSLIAKPPTSLYTSDVLMKGFDPDSQASIVKTFSFQQYLAFKPLTVPGRQSEAELAAVAAHDAGVNFHLLEYMYRKDNTVPKFVGVMGGASIGRSALAYLKLAELTRFLSQQGFTVVTGGGPGMMEAAHLGAYFSRSSDETWAKVIAAVKEIKANSPSDVISRPVKKKGENGWETFYDEAKLHAWFAWANQLKVLSDTPGESLAISTWEYGHEPVMPFATAYACYFQNSIRESNLVRESRAGIIYGRGGGGTLREIWQDVEENYYAGSREGLTPMILFDEDRYWGDLSSGGTATVDILGTIS